MFKKIQKHLKFANIISAIALFIALGGSAYAVSANSIGTKQLKKNAVTAKKIKKNAVTTAKVKSNAITAAKIKAGAVTAAKLGAGAVSTDKIADGAVTGAKVDLTSLGKVPAAVKADSATKADTATDADTATNSTNLTGQKTFLTKLSGGETAVLASYGQVALKAVCSMDVSGKDYIAVYASTTADGAVMGGDSNHNGGTDPSDFLNVATPQADRYFTSNTYSAPPTGEPYVDTSIDNGFVLGPDGKAIVANTEGMFFGVNYLGSDCIVGGVVNFVG